VACLVRRSPCQRNLSLRQTRIHLWCTSVIL
jgi:hypothetical protein